MSHQLTDAERATLTAEEIHLFDLCVQPTPALIKVIARERAARKQAEEDHARTAWAMKRSASSFGDVGAGCLVRLEYTESDESDKITLSDWALYTGRPVRLPISDFRIRMGMGDFPDWSVPGAREAVDAARGEGGR